MTYIHTLLFLSLVAGSLSVSHAQRTPLSKPTPEMLSLGRTIYENNCVTCHGVKGDGQGPAARAIPAPKPRDFTLGQFKYGSKDSEIAKTISDGVKDTAMPAWPQLKEKEKWAVVHYIRQFHKKKDP